MLPCFRALRPIFVLMFAFSIRLNAQDMPVRVEAIRLLERATAVSRPSHVIPDHKAEATFRACALDGTTQDGTFTGIYGLCEGKPMAVNASLVVHFPPQ
jgi:hypothetical protein